VVEGERNADDLSRALAQHIKMRADSSFGRVDFRPRGSYHEFGRCAGLEEGIWLWEVLQGKVVIKLGDNDGPGRSTTKMLVRI